MPTKQYSTLVFIGRFQPFHYGHARVVERARELADNVLILVGSSNRSRSMRNPWTFKERREMIRNTYPGDDLTIAPLDDVMYNDERWCEHVQSVVQENLLEIANRGAPGLSLSGMRDIKFALIGCEKDGTSYYLKKFPTWDSESVHFLNPINATDVRHAFFKGNVEDWTTAVPLAVKEYLDEFYLSEEFIQLHWEQDFVSNYQYNVAKYPRIEHTVDAVVIQSGHVLLIRRRAEPGKGMWAMPGGFLNQYETMFDGAIRELREETKIRVPEAVLRGSVVASKPYDDPHRSDRGRLITQAYLIHLAETEELPKVRGADDADKAKWVPLSELSAVNMFEDHYFIIQDLLGDV